MNRFPEEPRTKVFPWAIEPTSDPRDPGPPPETRMRPARRSYAEIDVVVADRDRDPRFEP